MVVCSACSNASLKNAEKELKDSVASARDSDNKYVLMVKNGYRENSPTLTYDKAFSAFFETSRWKYFKSSEGKNVVEFTGDCTYQDAAVKARIQFVVDEKQGTFEATYLALNEVPQNRLLLVSLIEKAFTSAPKQTESSRSFSNGISIDGHSVSEFLDRDLKEITKIMGTPESKDVFGIYYNKMMFWSDNGHQASNPSAVEHCKGIQVYDLSLVTIRGIRLANTTRDGIVKLLGNPDKEGWSEKSMMDDDDPTYDVEYNISGYNIMFYWNNLNDALVSLRISKIGAFN